MASGSTAAALVTGANKGIGLETARQLSQQFPGTVYLTARDEERGKVAAKALQDAGRKNVEFLQMDVTDKKSIEAARDVIKSKHGGLDILINNAGIFAKYEGPKSMQEIAKQPSPQQAITDTIGTNFTGLLNVSKLMLPILRPHARVVNVSSTLGSLARLPSAEIKQKLSAETLTVNEIETIMADYVRTGTDEKSGYPVGGFGPYVMSKIGVTALSRVQQRELAKDQSRPDIVVNACCPGYVATDLNNNSGNLTVQQGADTPVYLATLKDGDIPKGQFVKERKILNWVESQGDLKVN